MKFLFLGVLAGLFFPVHAQGASVLECGPSEKVIFKCNIKTKIALLCESKDAKGDFNYSYGLPGKKEILLPLANVSSVKFFHIASRPTPGGSMAYIHFSNMEYDYYLLDNSSKPSDGSFSPFSKLIVLKKNIVLKNSTCSNDDSGISQDAYKVMPREDYKFPIVGGPDQP